MSTSRLPYKLNCWTQLQKVKLNAPNGHASHWKTQSGDIELSQVHLETLILYVEKIEFKGSLQEVDTGFNTSWNPGLPWSTPPQITRKIDLSRRSPRQCNRLPRRPPARRCQVLRSPSRPSNLSRGKNPGGYLASGRTREIACKLRRRKGCGRGEVLPRIERRRNTYFMGI